MATPRMNFTLNDGTLPRESQATDKNRRIILIGTSSRGPMLEAAVLASKTDVRSLYGASNVGTLVRAFDEAYDAQSGSEKSPDIVCIRIGEELSSKANLELLESGGSTVALTLYSVAPGNEYNDVLVQAKTDQFKIYNPILEQWALFQIDFTGVNPSLYNDVTELADAINLNTISSGVIQAEVNYQKARYELIIGAGDAVDSNGEVTIDLTGSPEEQASNLIYDNSAVVAAQNLASMISSGSLKSVSSIDKLYAITASDFIEIPANSRTHEIPTGIVHKTAHASFDALLGVTQPVDNERVIVAVGTGAVATHTEYEITNHGMVAGDKFTPGLTAVADAGTAPELSNGVELTVTSVVDADKVEALVAWTDEVAGVNPTATLDFGLARMAKVAANDVAPAVSGQTFEAFDAEEVTTFDDSVSAAITVTIPAPLGLPVSNDTDAGFVLYAAAVKDAHSLTGDPASADLLPVLPSEFDVSMKAVYILSTGASETVALAEFEWTGWANGIATIELTVDGGLSGLVTSVKLTGISLAGSLNEVATGVVLAASTDYRFINNKLIFGALSSRRRFVRHLSRIDYDEADAMFLNDVGTITLMGARPGYNSGALSGEIYFGFEFDYVPDAFADTITALAGGSAGLGVVNSPIYFKREVAKALNEVENLDFAVVNVPKFYIDTVMTTYDETTGEEFITNAGYSDVLSSFLSDQYGGHAMAIMSPSPIVGTGNNGNISRADVNARFDELAVVSALNSTRASNKISAIGDLHLALVDMEVQFASDGIAYYAQAGAGIAGLLAASDSSEAVYTKYLSNARRLRGAFTERTSAGTSQVDALSDARINVGIAEAGGIRLSDGLLLAAESSDYQLISTFWMVEKMLHSAAAIGRSYLGKSPDRLAITALDNALRSAYDLMVPNEVTAFRLAINVDPLAKAMKAIDVQLQVAPAGEVRAFNVTTTLRAAEADFV